MRGSLSAACAGIIIALTSTAAHAAAITDVSPDSGTPGTTITLTGSGFTGATQLTFLRSGATRQANASFSVISDSQINAVVPLIPAASDGPVSFLLFTPAAVTMATDDDVLQITGNNPGGFGSSTVWIRNGGDLGGIGSSLIFVDSGGTYTSGGSGSSTILADGGSTVTVNGGGAGNTVYFEPTSNATVNPSYGFPMPVNDVSLSLLSDPFIYSIPEPASLASILLASTIPFRRRRPA